MLRHKNILPYHPTPHDNIRFFMYKGTVEKWFLDGTPSTIWVSENSAKGFKKVERVTGTDNIINSNIQNHQLFRICNTYAYTEYKLVNCIGVGKGVNCKITKKEFYFTVCDNCQEEKRTDFQDWPSGEMGEPLSGGQENGDSNSKINECAYSDNDAALILSSITGSDINIINTSTGAINTYQDTMRALKTIKWDFYKMNFILGYYGRYSAYLEGEIFKSKGASNWRWLKFNFVSAGQTAGQLPPCIDVGHTIAVSTLISNDRLIAKAILNASFVVTITCLYNTKTETINLNNKVSTYPASAN